MKLEKITEASLEDAFLLTTIAKAAKASWGYEEALLNLWANDLTITPELVIKWHTYTAMEGDNIVGFCMIHTNCSPPEIEHLWIEPNHQGKGIGKSLLHFALNDVANDFSTIGVTSDPFAEAFYARMGFVKTHEIPSKPEGRRLPYLLLKF